MMASYYTHCSVLLPKTPRTGEWALLHRQVAGTLYETDLETWRELYDCNFAISHEPFQEPPDDGQLWVYVDGDGSAEAAAGLVQMFLDDFEIEGGILMNIAWTCSKPRINEAGGCSVLITRQELVWLHPEQDLRNEASEGGLEVLN